jgi:sec-independent protein translocase protein TatC
MSSTAKQNHTLFDHLLELRTRLLHAVLGVLVVFCSLIYFAQDIYQYVAQPLLAVMPEGTQMIATDVASPFFTPFKLTIVLSIFITMPYILYQLLLLVCIKTKSA